MKIIEKPTVAALVLIAILALFFAITVLVKDKVESRSNENEIILEKPLKVLLYTKDGCIYCDMAKELLIENNISYEVVEITPNLDIRKKLINQTGQTTVPYVFINDQFVGGYNDLLKLKKENKF